MSSTNQHETKPLQPQSKIHTTITTTTNTTEIAPSEPEVIGSVSERLAHSTLDPAQFLARGFQGTTESRESKASFTGSTLAEASHYVTEKVAKAGEVIGEATEKAGAYVANKAAETRRDSHVKLAEKYEKASAKCGDYEVDVEEEPVAKVVGPAEEAAAELAQNVGNLAQGGGAYMKVKSADKRREAIVESAAARHEAAKRGLPHPELAGEGQFIVAKVAEAGEMIGEKARELGAHVADTATSVRSDIVGGKGGIAFAHLEAAGVPVTAKDIHETARKVGEIAAGVEEAGKEISPEIGIAVGELAGVVLPRGEIPTSPEDIREMTRQAGEKITALKDVAVEMAPDVGKAVGEIAGGAAIRAQPKAAEAIDKATEAVVAAAKGAAESVPAAKEHLEAKGVDAGVSHHGSSAQIRHAMSEFVEGAGETVKQEVMGEGNAAKLFTSGKTEEVHKVSTLERSMEDRKTQMPKVEEREPSKKATENIENYADVQEQHAKGAFEKVQEYVEKAREAVGLGSSHAHETDSGKHKSVITEAAVGITPAYAREE
ncbi:hypothetical protein HDU76_004877 [Blyttiomyces sp. JEL0837]|nr:hypothetical protein HDU76_004877 [Blyttiomyces sp. JEL0837]